MSNGRYTSSYLTIIKSWRKSILLSIFSIDKVFTISLPALQYYSSAHTHRLRDFTPTKRAANRGGPYAGGGADRFLAFLAEELFPQVESRYPTRNYRILMGHSLGGLFTVYAITAKPELFRAYLACSPWLRKEDDALISKIKSHLKRGPPKSKLLYIAHKPIRRKDIELSINKLVDVLNRNKHEDFEWDYKRYDDADRSNLPLKAIPDGLDFFFPRYNSRQIERLPVLCPRTRKHAYMEYKSYFIS